MRITTILVSTFLTWTAFDLNLFRRRRQAYAFSTIEVSLTEDGDELREVERLERHRWDAIPSWLRGARAPVKSRCNYFSTKPRDVRYSDQRKIRRRINNL